MDIKLKLNFKFKWKILSINKSSAILSTQNCIPKILYIFFMTFWSFFFFQESCPLEFYPLCFLILYSELWVLKGENPSEPKDREAPEKEEALSILVKFIFDARVHTHASLLKA